MNDKKTKFLVGFFMAGGLAIIVISIIWLGVSNFFQDGDVYSIFFDESVQGLNVEAPVKYRGVPIGRVQQIKVAADSHLIEVVIELGHEFNMQNKVIAQLKVVGITGNMFIELDHPSEQSPMQTKIELNFPTQHPVIQSRSSDFKQLFASIDEIVRKLQKIDIAEVVKGVQDTVRHIDTAVVGADIPNLSRKVQTSLDQFNTTIANSNLPETIEQLNSLLTHFDQTVQNLDLGNLSTEAQQFLQSFRQDSQALINTAKPLFNNTAQVMGIAETTLEHINHQLIIISQQTEKTNTKLNDFLGHISDQPSQLLFGDVPPRRLK